MMPIAKRNTGVVIDKVYAVLVFFMFSAFCVYEINKTMMSPT